MISNRNNQRGRPSLYVWVRLPNDRRKSKWFRLDRREEAERLNAMWEAEAAEMWDNAHNCPMRAACLGKGWGFV